MATSRVVLTQVTCCRAACLVVRTAVSMIVTLTLCHSDRNYTHRPRLSVYSQLGLKANLTLSPNPKPNSYSNPCPHPNR